MSNETEYETITGLREQSQFLTSRLGRIMAAKIDIETQKQGNITQIQRSATTTSIHIDGTETFEFRHWRESLAGLAIYEDETGNLLRAYALHGDVWILL